MTVLVMDSGALIAVERDAQAARTQVMLAIQGAVRLVTSSGVVAQVWRGGPRQSRLARLLGGGLLAEIPLDPDASRRIGMLAAAVNESDVVDGHVALLALDRDAFVVTSDPRDIARWGVRPDRILRC